MTALSACIEVLFKAEYPDDFAARIRAAAAAGLDAVEFWKWRGKDLDSLERALGDTGLPLVSFVSEPTGRLVDPATHETFLAGLRESLVIAKRLGARGLIVLSGDTLASDVPHAAQRTAVIKALQAAAPLAEAAGVTLLLEPLNTRKDHKGYFVDTTPEGFAIIEEVASGSVKLLYDLYHSAMMDENPAQVLRGYMPLVGHVHIADAPGRHEPGTGAIDWEASLAVLVRERYTGAIGLEYWPTAATNGSLASPQMAALKQVSER